uniref:Conotoxin superfamily P n=1 Tax=Conus magus TaxID=6492 RepID=A0A5P8I0P7_CONMA|nr:conotoxin superfamily P [Conus magus]
MHLSLAGSAVLMLLLLFTLGNFVGIQSGQITRDMDSGQLRDDRRNPQSQWKPRTLVKKSSCKKSCTKDGDCKYSCTKCTHLSKCM